MSDGSVRSILRLSATADPIPALGADGTGDVGTVLPVPRLVGDVTSAIALQGAVIGGVFSLLTLLVHLAIVVWTYRDAQRRSEQPAFLWAVVAFLAPLLGLVLYWLLGRDGG